MLHLANINITYANSQCIFAPLFLNLVVYLVYIVWGHTGEYVYQLQSIKTISQWTLKLFGLVGGKYHVVIKKAINLVKCLTELVIDCEKHGKHECKFQSNALMDFENIWGSSYTFNTYVTLMLMLGQVETLPNFSSNSQANNIII